MVQKKEVIVGIDLGTTNSEIAAFVNGSVQVLGPGETKMLPSCVGISPTGELLIGHAARNQQLVYPERTIRSIKRQMGNTTPVTIADRKFAPEEVSALILRELREWAERELAEPVGKAVITVPAYFSDAQRQATRQAGVLAGLEVVRIVNEPTAASLAYGYGGDATRRTILVYDLGGGTFDVSIVTMENDVTEVLASHGNNQLGGDDFNERILEHLLTEFRNRHGVDLRDDHPAAYSRLWWAAEETKRTLSFEPYATIREEALVVHDGVPLHLELELSRDELEDMIRPFLESTLDSVTRALEDADLRASSLDGVVLVGGSTRIPLVSKMLEDRTGIVPEHRVHPDLCVALGAAVLAGRLGGESIAQVLVDVSPYSFGPAYLGDRDGLPYPHCYHPVIQRNTPLPVTRTERYVTAVPDQTEVEVRVYQGENQDALKNVPVGMFVIEGLTPMEGPNEVLCRMSLDVDGILHVTAIEKITGKSKHVAIRDALSHRSEEEARQAQARIEDLFTSRLGTLLDEEGAWGREGTEGKIIDLPAILRGSRDGGDLQSVEDGESKAEVDDPVGDPNWTLLAEEARGIVERARAILEEMHPEDREEATELDQRIHRALSSRDRRELDVATSELKELLFFVEGA